MSSTGSAVLRFRSLISTLTAAAVAVALAGVALTLAVLVPVNGQVGANVDGTVLGGNWNFDAASIGNRVEISLSGLPPEGLGAADITVAFDSAVLEITSCDTGDLSGTCNPTAPGGPARAAGFAVPAITTEPVLIAGLIFDCVAASDGSSTLTITINELMDGTAGDPQPIPATVENGTVSCGSPDSDGDGVPDGQDNCQFIANGPSQSGIPGVGNQIDTDGDGKGDPCDLDADADGFPKSMGEDPGVQGLAGLQHA